jgi:glycosyltransferase involved in cell wall biosynthesis
MYISLIHPTMFYKGGAERAVVEFAKNLVKLGHVVEVVSLNFAEEWRLQLLREDIIIKSANKEITGIPYFLGLGLLAKKMAGFVSKECNVLAPHNFPAVLAAKEVKQGINKPIVWYCEEPFRFYYDDSYLREIFPHYKLIFQLSKRLYSNADKLAVKNKVDTVLANSKFTARNVWKVYLRDAHIVYLGVDTNKFSPGNPQSPLLIKYRDGVDCLIFAPLGRLGFPKNPIRLVAVANKIAKYNKNFKFIITGKGYLKGKIVDLINRFQLKDKVLLIEVPENLLPDFYRMSDIVIYLTLNEPFGLVPLEAMSSCVPVIVSDHGGPSETVVNGVTGLHANPYDVNLIAEKIMILMNDHKLRRSMGKEGRKHVLTNFTWLKSAMHYEKYLKSVGQ